MVSRKGTCWMCGALGVLTSEHAFPNWVRKIFSLDGHDIANTRHAAGLRTEARTWVNKSGGVTVRTVCRECNNGWMCALEARAKPILEPLITGHRATLDTDAQRVLALWAFKTACVFQSMNEQTATIASADRKRLAAADVIAPDIEITADGFQESGDKALCTQWYVAGSLADTTASTGASTDSADDASAVVDVSAMTLVIGRIVFQVRHRLPSAGKPTGAGVGSVVLHPALPDAVTWPPLPPLGPAELDKLTRPALFGSRPWDSLPPLLDDGSEGTRDESPS